MTKTTNNYYILQELYNGGELKDLLKAKNN